MGEIPEEDGGDVGLLGWLSRLATLVWEESTKKIGSALFDGVYTLTGGFC